jgi:hypothetical protein
LLADSGTPPDGVTTLDHCAGSRQRGKQVLRALSRTRKDLQKARLGACATSSKPSWSGASPAPLGLFADLHSQVAMAFLRRYPTSQAAAGLTQANLSALLRRIHCGHTPVAVLLERPTIAPAAARSRPDVRAGRVWPALDAIQVTHSRERELGPRSSNAWKSTPTSRSSPACPRRRVAQVWRRSWTRGRRV